MSESKKWRLAHGIIHNDNSITSRDSTSAEYDTRDEALASLVKQEKWYQSTRYHVQWATLYDPDGNKEDVLSHIADIRTPARLGPTYAELDIWDKWQ